MRGDLQEGHFTLPNANTPSARAQNRGFCVRKSNFSQVLPPLEHKIGELGYLCSGTVIAERAKGKSNRGEGVRRKGAVISETLTALNIQKNSFFCCLLRLFSNFAPSFGSRLRD